MIIKVVKTHDKFALFGSARNGRIECRLQEQFGLLAGSLVPNVAQELKCDPLVARARWFPGRPRGEDAPRNAACHEGASPSLHVQE
jgi:hypothetical protein